MDSPRSGLRRARAASCALAALGIAGVAGTSTLAYSDTFKPPRPEVPLVAVDSPAPGMDPTSVVDVTPAPSPVAATVDPAPPVTTDPAPPVTTDPAPSATIEPTVEQAPAPRRTQVSEDTPQATSQPTYDPAPAPVTHESVAPTTPPTTKRRSLTPATVLAPNYSPNVSVSRGS